jgi:hypothetical protein
MARLRLSVKDLHKIERSAVTFPMQPKEAACIDIAPRSHPATAAKLPRRSFLVPDFFKKN